MINRYTCTISYISVYWSEADRVCDYRYPGEIGCYTLLDLHYTDVTSAKRACADLGMRLISIETEAEYNYLKDNTCMIYIIII